MQQDLVVGIDSSTTATKAIAWDRHGRALAEGRATQTLSNPQPFFFEQDADDWWASCREALRGLLAAVDPRRIAALAIANQRESFAVLDADGTPLRPAILWLDERGREDVRLLEQQIGRERILAIIGKTPDPTPALYGLSWMRRHEPALLDRAAHIAEAHGLLVHRLTGAWRTSWASADPLGVYDLAAKRYSDELLAAVGLSADRFLDALRPGTELGQVTAAAATETGLVEGTPVIAGGGDGQAAGLGVGTLGGGRCYLNLGTAAVSGVWSAEYRTDPAWRTLTSLSGEGYIYEICLRTGTFLVDWFVKGLFEGGADAYGRLEQAAAALPVGAEGLLLAPYWSGSMTPWWDQDARGYVIGLSPEHGRAHLYRAMMEGIALDEAMGLARIEAATGEPVHEIVAIGGGSRSELWCRIVADATGRPVVRSATAEASALGAGICAAVGAGWYPDPATAAEAMAGAVDARIEPDPARNAAYRELLAIYESLYPALREPLARLAAFRRKEPVR